MLLTKVEPLEDITVFLLVGAVCILIVQYYVKTPAVYLLSEVLGAGSVYQVIQEVDGGTITNDVGVFLTIISVMAIIYGAMNLVNFWSKSKNKG